MPKLVDGETQREDIRAAARKVFARRGVRGTGLAHVAEAAGMGRSSLYHYYPDKDALLADLVREMLEQELELFRACLRGDDPPLARIDRLARACGALFPEWAAFGRMIIDLRLEDVRGLRGFFRELRGELAAVLEEGRADGSIARGQDSAVLASVLIGAIDGLLLQYFIDPKSFPSPDDLADTLGATARRMLSA